MSNFPQRHPNHSLERASEDYFRIHCPKDWNINPVVHDYGQDLSIDIPSGGQFTGLELVIQLKASERSSEIDGHERLAFKRSTYNYLAGTTRLVLIVKYIAQENEAYWILLRDIEPPNEENEHFTIYIPKANRLSATNWEEIVKIVKEVTDRKLGKI